MLSLFAFLSYSLSALLFVAFAAILANGRTGATQTRLLLVAALVNALWAAILAWQLRYGSVSPELLFVVEVARSGAWLAFLASVLGLAGRQQLTPALKIMAYVTPVMVLILGLKPLRLVAGPSSLPVIGSIGLAIAGLIILERIYRNADPVARHALGYLTLGIAGLFGYDLVMYSSSVMTGHIEAGLWSARGAANAAVVPFLMLAAQQHKDWRVEMFVSRQVAYFSFTLFGAGIYLILMAFGGYYVKAYGGSIGGALAAIFVFAAVLTLAGLLLSDRLRREIRVFFSKHFFRNRYDYREEWRRLSSTLYDPADERTLGERSIEAAARIMDSHSGFLLLQREGADSAMLPFTAWRRNLPEHVRINAGDSLVRYLENSNWIIDTQQYRDSPDFYDSLDLPDWLAAAESQQFVVPLLQGTRLLGVLVLDQTTTVTLSYEDTDLLKIVGRQVAGLMAQELDAERLAEGRQFQAYSRLTAFLMHDLKNLAAQQSLVVKNAAKHKRNPEFVDDAFATIEHSVKRINKLIFQLAERNRKEAREKVMIEKALLSVVNQVSDRDPQPSISVTENNAVVLADSEKLSAIFMHLMRNAQDACADDGEIDVELESDDAMVKVTVTDNGDGMDDTFIRERLFKPFESTKGVDGMGIGAYQVREYVKELRGYLQVDSERKKGTSISVFLPVGG